MTVLNPHLPAGSIIGVGHHLPSYFEDNETLCRNLDVTPEWIMEKIGIEVSGSPDAAKVSAETERGARQDRGVLVP